MFNDPIEQSSLKADVFAGFFAFNPFMLQNLRALGEELLVECRIFDELSLIFFRRWHLGFLFFHKTCVESTKSRIRIRRDSRRSEERRVGKEWRFRCVR